ncbi:MAG: hypothetical protein ACK5RR_05945 [Acidobacteriota bacterium]|jgi:hypothetical protein
MSSQDCNRMVAACFRLLVILAVGPVALFGVANAQAPSVASQSAARRLAFDEALRLIAGEDEGNLSRQAGRFTRTQLKDGRIIEIFYPLSGHGRSPRNRVPGYGMLYASAAAYHESTRPRHMLEELLPDGRLFIEQIPQLITRLERRLRISPGRLELTRVGLRRVDLFLRQHHANHTTAQTDPRLFQELTAYYGETLRRAVQGQWRIDEERVSSSHRQAEPNLLSGADRILKPWSSVIRVLYDEDNRGVGLTKSFDTDSRSGH